MYMIGLPSIVDQLKVLNVSCTILTIFIMDDIVPIANLTGAGNSLPYHAIPSIIAVNMILAVASGGVLSVLIASWAQVSTANVLAACLIDYWIIYKYIDKVAI